MGKPTKVVGGAIKGLGKAGAVKAGKALGIGAVAAGGYYSYLMVNGMTHEEALAAIANTPSHLVDTVVTQFGEGSGRAEAQSMAETGYAYVEQFGRFLNNVFGGSTALGLINWARGSMTEQAPLIYTSNGLMTANEIELANIVNPDLAVSDIEEAEFRAELEAEIKSLGGNFNDMTVLAEALKRVDPEMADEIDAIKQSLTLESVFNSLDGMTGEAGIDKAADIGTRLHQAFRRGVENITEATGFAADPTEPTVTPQEVGQARRFG